MSERTGSRVAPTVASLIGAVVGLLGCAAVVPNAEPTNHSADPLHIAENPPTIAPYAMCATSMTTGVATP
jgi:hypothetical protein